MRTAIILGANGQDGHYCLDYYRSKGFKVVGVSRTGPYLQGDVGSFEFIEKLVKKEQPQILINFAAASTVKHAALFENHRTIGTGTLNILEAVYRWQPECKVFLAGSGLQFVNRGLPIHELDPFHASSPYSIERIYSDYAAQYYRTLGLKVYFGYLFHHDSPLRGQGHISQKVVSAAKRIAGGSREKLELGDISVQKEWAFAGDIVAGIGTMLSQERVFSATIGTGIAYSIQEWLEVCFSSLHLDWRHYVITREGFIPEFNLLVSNPATIMGLGWQPKVGFHQLAELMLQP